MKGCEVTFYMLIYHFDLHSMFYVLEEKVAQVCAETRALATQNIINIYITHASSA